MKIDKKIRRAFTLVEMILSVGCGSLILAAVVTAGVCLQRSFAAVEGYSTAESDQLRVLDYIAMDCRRAIGGSINTLSNGTPGTLTTPAVSNGSWSGGNWVPNASGPATLILSVPAYYDSSGNPVLPTINSSNGIQYGTAPVTISYARSGSNFVRSVLVGSTMTTTAIATNVSTFTVTPLDYSGINGTVSCSITFSPRFVYLPGPGPIAGTTVYCNTFLRNASAR
jgi:Tfp pilus assembly protein PilW